MLVLVAILFISGLCFTIAVPGAPTQLLLEHMPEPVMGIDVKNPRASWTIPGSEDVIDRYLVQSAYQILVSHDPTVPMGDVWDSGKVMSSNSVLIPLGLTIASDTTYYWKVRLWDQTGAQSDFSSVARFDSGLLMSTDWQGATWIGGANQLRKEFQLTSAPSMSKVYISGIGYYELFINGQRVSDYILDVPWTNYHIRATYRVHDVTKFLKMGTNAIAVTLGNGWWGMKAGNGGERMLMFLLSAMTGNTKSHVISDSTWTMKDGPITFDSVYDGETYDARLESPGWNMAEFNETWTPTMLKAGPGGALKATIIYPIKIANELKPLKMTQIKTGVYIYDFGQNMSGFCKLLVKGNAGTVVTLRHAEVLQKDGSLYVDNLRSAKATDVYTLKGDMNGEMYQPRFTYHGFRFVELTGFPGTPTLDTLTAYHVYSSVPTSGRILLKNPILDKIQANIWWGQTSNLMSVPTDCDQRDERLGWMADGQLSAEEALYNFDMGGFYHNWVELMHDDQGSDGTITDVVPFIRYGGRPADPAWGAAYPLLVYWLYKYKAETRLVMEQYNGVKAWLDYLTSRVEKSGIGNMYFSYGDWVPPPPTPRCNSSLTSSFYYLLNLQQLSELAALIGNTQDHTKYANLYSLYSGQLNKAFFNNNTNSYANGVQTCLILPLSLSITPDPKAVLNNLLNDIVTLHKTHLTSGIVGVKYLMSVLSAQGRKDVALSLALQITYPSWGYMFNQDLEAEATTLWELWDSPSEGPGMDSRNHIMFGSISAWFYQNLAGIQQTKTSSGFSEIVFRPPEARVLMQSPLYNVSASYNTPYGLVKSAWEVSGGTQCRQILPKFETTIGCGPDGGVISQVYITRDCSVTKPIPNYFVGIKDSLINCIGKSSCTLPAQLRVSESGEAPVLKAVCSAPPNLRVKVQVAPNTIGHVYVSTSQFRNPMITEGGQPAWLNAQHVTGRGILGAKESGEGHVVFKVGSGSYDFHVTSEDSSKLICAMGSHSKKLVVECPSGTKVSMVAFASYGTPLMTMAEGGDCRLYEHGDFHTGSSVAVVEDLCLYKDRCEVSVDPTLFGLQESTEEYTLATAVYCS